jgi:hypothetical protein
MLNSWLLARLLHSRGLEKNDAIYETPTIVLVINFVRRRLSAYIGLVRRQPRTCYASDPQNDWNEFARILKRCPRNSRVHKQDLAIPKPSAARTLPGTRETLG